MFLQDIDIRPHIDTQYYENEQFNISSFTVENLFFKKLGKKYNSKKFWKILLYLHETLIEKENYQEPPKEKRNKEFMNQLRKTGKRFYQNMIEPSLDVVYIHRKFYFTNYFEQDKETKKRLILEQLHEGTKIIAKQLGWDSEPFDNAYKKCLELNLQNNWISEKLKTKSSPNRKYKGAIYFEYDIYEIQVFAIIYNQNGEEITRPKLFILNGLDENVIFPDDIMPIINGKTRWEKNEFILYDKSGKEISKVKI